MVMMMETLANVTINGALVTAVYVKVTRPLTKDSTRLFSKSAVVSAKKRVWFGAYFTIFAHFRSVKEMERCALFLECAIKLENIV